MTARSFAIKPKRTSKPARRTQRSSSAPKHLAQPVIIPTRKLPIQAKLTIGQPNDKYEQEADRVSDQVMRMTDADVAQRVEAGTVQPMHIQRLFPECKQETAQRQPENEEEEELQAKEIPGQIPTLAPNLESRINSLKGGGQPLDSATRSFFEPRFGHDFGHVRVHTDSSSADTAKSINARAFTLGNHVVMGSGEYQPKSQPGQHLLGHELTHVVQQGGGVSSMTQSVGSIESGPIDLQKIYLPNANKSEPFLVQRSPLSDELEYIYTTDGRDAFFSRLNDVQQSDSDLDSFVRTLNNVDRDIALSIMGESQFDSATRQAVISEFVLRLASAQDDFDRAVGMVEEDIKAEAQAQADLANLLVGIAFAFVVPGIGRAITSLTNMLPINASTGAYQAALLIQAQAGNIASAIGEAGKHGAKEVISNQLSNNPRSFFNVLREGFQAGNQEILAYIRNNIISIPDYELLIYLANWDSREITADRYATQLRLKWNQYEREVLEIDEFSAYVRAAGSLEIMDTSYMTLVRVQSSSGDLQLAIIEDYTHQSGIRISSRENWMRAVSPEFEPMALERARRKGEVVRTMNASDISDVPSQYR